MFGVLDVQSTQKNAFSEEDITVLATLGDQLAVAMDNTRLLTETRRALITAEQTYQRYFNQAWSQFAHSLKLEGYEYHNGKVAPLSEIFNEDQEKGSNNLKLSIPLMIRGQDIGILDIQPSNEKRKWSTEEIAVIEAAAERAALALESARLLEDAQRRAARERTIGEMTASIGASTDMESILRIAVSELGRQISGAKIAIELSTGIEQEES